MIDFPSRGLRSIESRVPEVIDFSALKPDDLSGIDLVGIDFSGRSLVGANFAFSTCKDCKFVGCDLSQANFEGADLYRCDFSHAILYAVTFDNANLTRADFTGACIYGWLLNSTANINYAKLLGFDLERRRRTVHVHDDTSPTITHYAFGAPIPPSATLCEGPYQVGRFRFTFADLEAEEESLQRSQIYGRLKRLYRENQDGECAIHCMYWERHHLTRTWQKASQLTGSSVRGNALSTLLRTATAYLNEVLFGYGVRPIRILRTMAVWFALFFAAALLVTHLMDESGVIQERATPSGAAVVDLGKQSADFGSVLQFTILTVTSPDLNRFNTYGWMSPLSIIYFFGNAVVLAVLFSSIFVRLVRE